MPKRLATSMYRTARAAGVPAPLSRTLLSCASLYPKDCLAQAGTNPKLTQTQTQVASLSNCGLVSLQVATHMRTGGQLHGYRDHKDQGETDGCLQVVEVGIELLAASTPQGCACVLLSRSTFLLS